jgi:hypothetical protein
MHKLVYVARDEYDIQTHLKPIFLDLITFKFIKFIRLHVPKPLKPTLSMSTHDDYFF